MVFRKNLIDGQKVVVNGKVGEIISIADKIKVKFEDGSFGFFDALDVEPIVMATTLKNNNSGSKTILIHPEAMRRDPLSQKGIVKV